MFDDADDFSFIHDQMADAVYLIDPASSNIIWVNRAGHEDLLMQRHEVLNHSVLSLQKHVTENGQWQAIADVIRAEKRYTFNGHHCRKDGSEFPVEVNTTVFVHQDKELFLSVARDISSRRAYESKDKGREAQILTAIDASSDGLWDWEIEAGAVYFSPSLKRMLGYGPDEMPPVVETWKDNIHPSDQQRVLRIMGEHLNGQRERYAATYRLRNRNGHYLWVHDTGCVSEYDEELKPVRATGIVTDVTRQKLLEQRLQELAAYDELTGLRNRRESRRVFDSQLHLAERHHQPLGMALIDLDFFKSVNDQLGHVGGDYVLKTVARVLEERVRRSDFLFRWGGEEFLLLSPQTELQAMIELCEQLRHALETYEMCYEQQCLWLTASFGIATYPDSGSEPSELMLAMDTELYRAKSQGRNQVCYPDKCRHS
ncbi:diguanylate cyclase [Motiliproteus coralliicola]|uniref:Diguanylate cyclase n=1 Tax=Motiliproteus coralliicola TaxID=2283196 RepID=A0A369WRM6_9GAMM|nr:diguanylate cyclase [Motiliproteus coralliicola]RDE24332.1 diguanylate cyclase [Motiliproteus coralliicola]